MAHRLPVRHQWSHWDSVLEITWTALFCNASSKCCCPNHEALHEKLHNFLSWENCSPPSSLQACNCTPININLGYQLVSWYPLLGDYSPRLCKQTIKWSGFPSPRTTMSVANLIRIKSRIGHFLGERLKRVIKGGFWWIWYNVLKHNPSKGSKISNDLLSSVTLKLK